MAKTEVRKGTEGMDYTCYENCTELSSSVFESLSSVKSACVFQSELRTSISTNASDLPSALITNPRHKQRHPVLRPSQAKCFQPLNPSEAAQLTSTIARLKDLYEQLEEEIEPFCIRECMPKLRACQLAPVPAASSLMRRRGLAVLSL